MVSVRRESSGKILKRDSPSKAKPSGFLDSVSDNTSESDVGISMIVYGKEGVGKTSLAAYAPSPIFLIDKNEHGVHRLKKQRLIPSSVKVGPDIETWENLLAALDELLSSDSHAYETVVLDSLTGFQRLCFKSCCDAEFKGDMSKEGFFAYSNGPKIAAQSYWPDLTDRLTDLQQQNINIIVLGHTVVKTFNNPEGADFDRITPDVDKAVWTVSSRWAGAVLYYKHNIDIIKEGRKTKASGGEQRIICAEYDAAYDAKNSYGLPAVLDPFGSAKECWADLWYRIKQEPIKKLKQK